MPVNVHQKRKEIYPILKIRKGKLEYILYDIVEKEQLEWDIPLDIIEKLSALCCCTVEYLLLGE